MRYQSTIRTQALAKPPVDRFEPSLEELGSSQDLSRTGTRVLDRRALLAIALAAAVVGYGFLSGDAGRAPARGDDAVQGAQANVQPLVLLDPSRWASDQEGGLRVTGSSAAGSGPLRVSVVLGSVVLGSATVRPRGGTFKVDVPVVGPHGAPALLVSVVVEDVTRGTELARRDLTIPRRPPITLSAAPSRVGNSWLLELSGGAARGIDGLEITVTTRGSREETVERVDTLPVHDPTTAAAAALLGVVRWEARLELAEAAATSADVAIRWSWDGSAGVTYATILLPETPPHTGRLPGS